MRFHKRFGPGLVSLSVMLAAVAICGLQPASAQALRQTTKRLVISDIVGKDTVHVGDVETYRAITNQVRDVEFRWTARGQTSLGNPIVHRFERPGTFDVVVTARNVVSTVSDTFRITVLGPEPPPVAEVNPVEVEPSAKPAKPGDSTQRKTDSRATRPSESTPAATVAAGADSPDSGIRTGGGHVDQNSTGYTWVIATYFTRPSAVALANSYRASGYKAGVVADRSGQGAEVFRVILGEFATEKSALRAKPHLIRAGHKNVLLRELGGRG